MTVDACQERKGDTMNRESSILGLLRSNGKQDPLMSDRVLVLVASLLALAMAVVFVLAVMPYT
jgi:hypothetical protein